MSPPNRRPGFEPLFGVEVGDVVQAIKTILEEGGDGPPNPNAGPCEAGWVHAENGDLGVVVHVEPGFHPTVRWHRTGTATACVEGSEFIHVT